ncbi:MAG: response regulator transcription factor [Campylobacteraceae bacterium]
MRAKLFLLEDDKSLNETICEFLEECGFEVKSATNGEEAFSIIYENSFDLLILDVNVPDINGFKLLKELRESGNQTPAIFVTSLNGMDDLEEGYESGCDDYLKKPFALKELLLRVETLLKRQFLHVKDEKIKITQNCSFDANSLTLFQNNQKVILQAKEAKLLSLLLKRKDEITPHELIMSTLWDFDEAPSEESVRTYIKNLRKILGKESIVSFKKLGYQLRAQ